MRVITGQARGRRLKSREGQEVRPTAARVKAGMFSAIQFDLEGRRILDLFAGSGQLGIEALSRGAVHCTFVDAAAESTQIIKDNLAHCGLIGQARVIRADYAAFLARCEEQFDILFLDPPYGKQLFVPAIEAAARVLSEAAVILCEHPSDFEFTEPVAGFALSRVYRYGKICVSLLRRVKGEDTP